MTPEWDLERRIMTPALEVRTPIDDQEVSALVDALVPSFNIPRDKFGEFADRLGRDNVRIVVRGDQIAGGMGLIPMGQFFGGVSVPMVGVTIVGIAPAFRGRHAAATLMAETMRELASRRVALSALYPATQTLYRRSGFEQAGGRFEVQLPLNQIDAQRQTLEVRPIEPADEPAVESTYRRDAARHAGQLDRSANLWHRVRQGRDLVSDGYLVERDGSIEGYIYYVRVDRERPEFDLCARDLVALTPEAGRALLAFVADHRSLSRTIVLNRHPADAIFTLLSEQAYESRLEEYWMLRIVDAEAALSQRRYAPAICTEIHFNVRDDIVEQNNGALRLRIEGGRGSVTREGEGRLDIDIRGLAALYSGFRTPRQLLASGLLRATEEDAAAAAGVFSDGEPWMSDMF